MTYTVFDSIGEVYRTGLTAAEAVEEAAQSALHLYEVREYWAKADSLIAKVEGE